MAKAELLYTRDELVEGMKLYYADMMEHTPSILDGKKPNFEAMAVKSVDKLLMHTDQAKL